MQILTIPSGKNTSMHLPVQNHQVEINVEENAKLSILEIARPNCAGKIQIHLGKNAVLELGIICLDNAKVETELNLQHSGAMATLGAMFLGSDEQSISLNTIANHVAPNTRSRINIYGALKGKAKASSIGNIKIEKTGQGTDAFFASHALLLDKNARAESVPALEIKANDVKAGHSASTTKLSEEQLFYCRSRGLEEKEAEKIIVFGFLQRAFTGLPFKTDEKIEEKWTSI